MAHIGTTKGDKDHGTTVQEGVTLRRAAPILGIAALLLLAVHTPAQAVPGWAQTYRDIHVMGTSCAPFVVNAFKSVTSTNPAFDKLGGSGGSMISGFVPDTGIFVYCIPSTSCTSTVAILTFSDKGSGEAAKWRDQINTAIGNPSIQCPVVK